MKLEGIHHITCITGDAPRNVEFYVGTLGLRLVKKSVNQDDPSVYHLFYADEKGSAGSDITFFEYPGAAPGRAGAGMIHRITWRVGNAEAIPVWEDRLRAAGDRQVLLQVRLFQGAERRAVRDRHARARLHRRRTARNAWRKARATSRLRAPARRAREEADAAAGRASAQARNFTARITHRR